MNKLYKITLSKPAATHVEARFSPYDIAITADTYDNAVRLIRECIIGEGTSRKDFDPADVSDNSDGTAAYFCIDMEREFRIRNTASVRKNITLPEWMDISLRELDVDASKLFQEAALKRILAEEESKAAIATVADLESSVPKEILDQYVMKRMKCTMKNIKGE